MKSWFRGRLLLYKRYCAILNPADFITVLESAGTLKFRNISPRLIAAVVVVLLFALSLVLRTTPAFEKVFTEEGIKYTSSDAYYMMRQVDNLAYNYPEHSEFDPYFIYPDGHNMRPRFFVWMLGTLSWLFGLGSPPQHVIDLVGVYIPAIFGALCVIPVYVIGKELVNRWVGVLSAGLITIMPGEFVGRTMLGFTDYHAAETLFTALAMMFLVLAVKTAADRKLSFNHVKSFDWAVMRKPLIYSLLAGFFLWLYIFTWAGALLFVFIIFLYLVIQFIIDHLKRKPADYLYIVSAPMFLFTLILSVFIHGLLSPMYYASLVIALVVPPVMGLLSGFIAGKKWKAFYYPLAVVGIGAIGLGLFYLVSPSLVRSMLSVFGSFVPQGAQLTTTECSR
jgi:dolichyl-diphosphooligosaccharide--protein glycosyltransferase